MVALRCRYEGDCAVSLSDSHGIAQEFAIVRGSQEAAQRRICVRKR
ncbi:Uncharacterised protein [Mycobacteroides abscessus subsp. abscessus]|nr:Uncharacterised protein [Mycobacteroides abscessus subsp. abscessus]